MSVHQLHYKYVLTFAECLFVVSVSIKPAKSLPLICQVPVDSIGLSRELIIGNIIMVTCLREEITVVENPYLEI